MNRFGIVRSCLRVGFLWVAGTGCATGPVSPEPALSQAGHGSGGVVTEAMMEAARTAYARQRAGRARKQTDRYAIDVTDPSAVDPAVFERAGVHVLLAFPNDDPNGAWDDGRIQETTRVLLGQRADVWQANGVAEAGIVPLTILYTYHDIPGSGQLNDDSFALYQGHLAPGTPEAPAVHALKAAVGADFIYVVVPDSEPINEEGWRYYGWQNLFLQANPASDLAPQSGGVLWSEAVEAAALSSWSKLILAHEMDGHGMGGCGHIPGVAGVDLMRASTPWGTNLRGCAASSFATAAYVAAHWPAAQLDVGTGTLPHPPDPAMQFQNYPNPFAASTTITYTLPQAERVYLTVYDVLGRPVATLENGMRHAGTHRVVFDAARRPNGLYVYRLTIGSHAYTRTMTRTGGR